MRRNANGKKIDVEPYLEDLRRYLEDLDGLVAAWIYGSDLSLLFQKNGVPDSDRQGRVSLDVRDVLHQDGISITILNLAPILFQFRVLATGRRLACSDPVAMADFVEWVISRHGDFEVYSEKLVKEFGPAILEQFCYEFDEKETP